MQAMNGNLNFSPAFPTFLKNHACLSDAVELRSGIRLAALDGEFCTLRELSAADSETRRQDFCALSRPWRRRKKSFGVNAIQSQPLTSVRPWRVSEQEDTQPRRTHRKCIPQSRDTPPKRDTGIASEKEWGINLKNEKINEAGVNEDGSTWYRESDEDLGENGYRCRWTVMGGRSADGSTEWREAWWEKSDWTGYKELGAEKSGKNAEGDSWWETWQEVLRQDEWRSFGG